MPYAQVTDGLVVGLSPTPTKTANIPCGEAVQVGWQYKYPTFSPVIITPTNVDPTSLQIFLTQVKNAIVRSDKTMLRVQEAISLGLTSSTTADVVAYVNYRRALRALLTSTSVGTLPASPPYPVGS